MSLHYSVYQHLPEKALTLMAGFAIGITLFGLCLDLLSLYMFLHRNKDRPGASVGFPFIPWMLYFLGGFLWFLRGSAPLGMALFLLLTLWHIGLHLTIYRITQRAVPHHHQ